LISFQKVDFDSIDHPTTKLNRSIILTSLRYYDVIVSLELSLINLYYE